MKHLLVHTVNNLDQFNNVVKEIHQILTSQSIVLLSGPLGAGKTTFVSLFCRLIGAGHVQSPTYSIHHRYEGVDHFDLYRLETAEQVESSAFFDLLNESKEFVFIEWPERINFYELPQGRPIFQVKLDLKNDTSREITLSKLN